MERYPLLFIALIWITGLYIGNSFGITFPSLIISSLVSFILIFLFLVIFRRNFKIALLILAASIFFIAFVRIGWYQSTHQTVFTEELNNEELGIRGYIDTKPLIDGDLVKFAIKPVSYQQNGKEIAIDNKEKLLIYLYLQQENELDTVQEWQKGMGIKIFGTLSEPVSTHNPGLIDYERYLERKAIYWRITVKDISNINVSAGSKMIVALNNFKTYLANSLNSIFPAEQAGFMNSILLGNKQDLFQELRDDFSILGLSHLLAISGLHLSVITFILFWVLNGLGVTRERAIYIISIILLSYMLLTGASASVVRATIMTLLILYGFFFERSLSALQALGIAAILMTIYNPMWIFDIGFQLSFLITFFLLFAFDKVKLLIPIEQKYLRNALTLLIITQAASFPLVFYSFHQYSLISWIANLIIVPVFSLIVLPVGVILLILSSLKLYIANIFSALLSYLLAGLFNLIHYFAKFSFFHFYGTFSSPLFVITVYILLIWFLLRLEIKASFISFRAKRIIYWLEKGLLIIIIGVVLLGIFSDNEGVITFIDVGQGDSFLIQTPDNYNILIDSGGVSQFTKDEWRKREDPFDIGKDIILPFLRYKGINRLDMAILSHEDFDHLGGYLSLVDKINIDIFVVHHNFPHTEGGQELEQKIIAQGIKLVKVDDIKIFQKGKNLELTFLPVDVEGTDSGNDNMLLTFLRLYQINVIFTGDLEMDGEKKLLNNYELDPVEILKVGHHGSGTSTTDELLLQLQPKDAVISVGINNRYHHPSEQVISKLEKNQIKIWRTDLDGAITIEVGPKKYEIIKTVD